MVMRDAEGTRAAVGAGEAAGEVDGVRAVVGAAAVATVNGTDMVET